MNPMQDTDWEAYTVLNAPPIPKISSDYNKKITTLYHSEPNKFQYHIFIHQIIININRNWNSETKSLPLRIFQWDLPRQNQTHNQISNHHKRNPFSNEKQTIAGTHKRSEKLDSDGGRRQTVFGKRLRRNGEGVERRSVTEPAADEARVTGAQCHVGIPVWNWACPRRRIYPRLIHGALCIFWIANSIEIRVLTAAETEERLEMN